MMQRKTAKAPDFYSIVSYQRLAHVFYHAVNCQPHVFPRQMWLLFSQYFNEF